MFSRRAKRNKDPQFRSRQGEFLRAAGEPIAFAAETDRVPGNIDHFWITLRIGNGDPLRIALSTHSRQNARAGFDPRLRVAVVISAWSELPEAGLHACARLDYHEIESSQLVTYFEYERPARELQRAEGLPGPGRSHPLLFQGRCRRDAPFQILRPALIEACVDLNRA